MSDIPGEKILRDPKTGRLLPGSRMNPGGRSRQMRDIEAMLDNEHRTVENMREVFARLKALALGEVVTLTAEDGGFSIGLKADARFMQLYLDRTLGPVKALELDMSEAPQEVLSWLADNGAN